MSSKSEIAKHRRYRKKMKNDIRFWNGMSSFFVWWLRGALLHPKLFVRYNLDYIVFYAWNAYFRFGKNIQMGPSSKKEPTKMPPKEHVTISLGGTVCVTGGPFDFSSVLQKVDEYLYQSRNNGKDVSCLDGQLIRS